MYRRNKRYTYKQLRLRKAVSTLAWLLVLTVYMTSTIYGIASFTANAINCNVYTDHSTSGVERRATVTLAEPLKSSESEVYSVVVTDIGCYTEEPEVMQYQLNTTYSDCITSKHPVLIECADWELEELARLAFLEAGSDWISDDCIRAVIEVAFNQLNYGAWGDTLHEVIFSVNSDGTRNYSPALDIPYTEPTERCREIVKDVYENGIALPSRVMFFRAYYYHQWLGAVPEFEIDGVYFSSSWWCE